MRHFIKVWVVFLSMVSLVILGGSIWTMPIQWAQENKSKSWECGNVDLEDSEAKEFSLSSYDVQRVKLLLSIPYIADAIAAPVDVCSIQVKNDAREVIDGMIIPATAYGLVIPWELDLPPTASIVRVANIHASVHWELGWSVLYTSEGDQ